MSLSLSLELNLAVFAGAAVLVWLAGTRLARYADAIGARTGLSHAFLGMVLLGVATSLPEIATTASGAWIGNAPLITGNLFGGVALQVAVLAIADAATRRGGLTYFAPSPVLLFQGVMLVLLLSVALAGTAAREPLALYGVGLTPVLLAAGYLVTLRGSHGEKYLPKWRPSDELDKPDDPVTDDGSALDMSNRSLFIYTALAAAVITGAGTLLAVTGDALAEQTGLGSSFVGTVLLAASTSLPELSTVLGALRRGNYRMAVSNILGTNCLELALFLPADLLYRGGPLLAVADRSAMFAAALGLIVTCLFLLGLLERRNKTIFGMGIDSFAVLIVYGLGLGVLYALR